MNQVPAQDPAGSTPERYLLLGDIGLHYPLDSRPQTRLAVVELAPSPYSGTGRQAVEYLKPAATAARSALLLDGGPDGGPDGEQAGPVRTFDPPAVTWRGTAVDRDFARVLADWRTPSGHTLAPETLTPLGVLRVHRGAERVVTEVLMCTRMREIGTVFARVAAVEQDAGASVPDIVREALTKAHELRDCVAVEWQTFTRFDADTEVELKLTLGERIAPWGMASRICAAVAEGELKGFIPDVGNELHRWHFRQTTFEILEPAAECGYIAFIRNPSGSYGLKHKVFAEEGLRRTETFRDGLSIPLDDFEGFLAREYPHLSLRRLPPFTRTRFDVNLESTATGHFFGIEVDEVAVPEYGTVLQQVELEYYRSRIHDGMDRALIEKELYRLADETAGWLAKAGVSSEQTFYSKLSFLRDCVAGTGSSMAVPATGR